MEITPGVATILVSVFSLLGGGAWGWRERKRRLAAEAATAEAGTRKEVAAAKRAEVSADAAVADEDLSLTERSIKVIADLQGVLGTTTRRLERVMRHEAECRQRLDDVQDRLAALERNAFGKERPPTGPQHVVGGAG